MMNTIRSRNHSGSNCITPERAVHDRESWDGEQAIYILFLHFFSYLFFLSSFILSTLLPLSYPLFFHKQLLQPLPPTHAGRGGARIETQEGPIQIRGGHTLLMSNISNEIMGFYVELQQRQGGPGPCPPPLVSAPACEADSHITRSSSTSFSSSEILTFFLSTSALSWRTSV